MSTTIKSWCKHCQKATASIRVITNAGGHIFLCAECRNP